MNDQRDERPSNGDGGDLEGMIGEIVGQVTGRRPGSSRDEFSALGIDSLALLEVLAVLEQRFAVEFSEDILTEFRSVERIAAVLREAIKPSSGASRGVDWDW